jgi:hypothetical protein
MRFVSYAALFAILSTVPAVAGDDIMTSFFGNTIIATGGIADVHINYYVDHSFVMTVPAFHMSFKGTWKTDGADVCRTFDSPPPGATNPQCTPLGIHKVGDSWSITTDGKVRNLELVQGLQ